MAQMVKTPLPAGPYDGVGSVAEALQLMAWVVGVASWREGGGGYEEREKEEEVEGEVHGRSVPRREWDGVRARAWRGVCRIMAEITRAIYLSQAKGINRRSNRRNLLELA